MKFYRRNDRSKFFCLLLLWFLMMVFVHEGLAVEKPNENVRMIPEEEMPVILQSIGDDVRENYERIGTWLGEIDKKIMWVHRGSVAENLFKNATDANGETPESILQKAEERTTFAIDANNNFVYVDTLREKRSKYFNYSTGANLGNKGSSAYWATVVAEPNLILVAEPKKFEKETGRIMLRRAVKEGSKRKSQRGLYEDIDDPRKVFFPSAEFTWANLNGLIERINRYGKIEFDGYRLKIEEHQKGNITEYRIIQPGVVSLERSKPEHYVILTKVFSSQYNFNMISWEAASGSGMLLQTFAWEYELTNGVYLPKRVVEKHYGSSGEVVLEKELTYTNNKVNQEISPETFTYKNLGLKNGDEFIDKVLRKEYRYQDGKLVPVGEK